MPPATWSLRLLGPPELDGGMLAAPLVAQRPHQLLAYLAARGEWVHRDHLSALFWPERGDAAARSNLRKVLLLARQWLHALAPAGGLAAPPVEESGDSLRWPVPTDSARFLQGAAAGRFDDAITLYRGPLLQGLDDPQAAPFADWLLFERSRLAVRWRDCMLGAAQAATSPQRRAELAARLLARDPLDEAALRLQLVALAHSGRQGDAQQAYRRYALNLAQETGLEPGADLEALAAGTGTPDPADPRPSNQSAAFFGRSEELDMIQRELLAASGIPLVLVGPGGVGKSRLLAEAVRRFGQHFAQGAVNVPLHAVRSAADLPAHIAQALGLALSGPGDALTALCVHLNKRELLLALDNFEHLTAAVPMIEHLRALCPALRFVIASRVRPGLAGERLLPIGGLACPQADDTAVEGFDAVRLFAHHARRVRPAFDLAAEAADVGAICRLVEGLPLALELAAGWARLFRCADIAADLAHSLDLLGAAGAEGHSPLGALLDQTWALLVPNERRVFALLAVFEGSFDHEALQAVTGGSLAVTAALIDKSLVRAGDDGRLSLHPLIRRFAEARLQGGDASCTLLQARQRHAEHFSRLLGALRSSTADTDQRMHAVGVDLQNCCAAWRFALAQPAPEVLERSVEMLGRYFMERGPNALAMELLSAGEQVLQAALPPRTAARAVALRWRATLDYRVGELGRAESDARLALALAASVADAPEQRRSQNLIGVIAWARGDLAAAGAAFEQVSAGLTPGEDIGLEANLAGNLGLIAQATGRFEEARERFAAALVLYQRRGSQVGIVQQLLNLGSVCWGLHQWREVLRLMGEALALARKIDYVADRPYGLRVMAQAHLELAETAAARNCCLSALALLDEGGEPIQRATVLAVMCEIELADGDQGAAAKALREAALAASSGALAHDCMSVVNAWASLLRAQGREAEAATLWCFLSAHPAPSADQRPRIAEALGQARARLAPADFAACERKAATLDLDTLLTQAVSLLAPTP